MRPLFTAALALAIAAPVAAPAFAAEEPAEAQAALQAIRDTLRSPKNAKFRKVKINAAGDVCATVALGGDDDTEVLWSKASGQIWGHEGATAQDTIFNLNNPALRRSDERADFIAWKACQKGG